MFIFSLVSFTAVALGISRLPNFIQRRLTPHPSMLEIASDVPTCQNGGTLSADGTSCNCGSSVYSGLDCSVACNEQGDLLPSGGCHCYSGYFGTACQNSVAERLAKLATYCSKVPDMTALGSAGVELNMAESALLSLCPPPATTS